MSSVSGSGERVLAILDLFTEARPEWTTDEMRAALGYTRPTLYRYLRTLKEAGFLVSLPQAGYTLGPRVTELDYLMERSDPLLQVGQPRLDALATEFPGSAFLVRWYGSNLLCVASKVSAPRPLSSYPRGRPMPLGRGAISRAILAFLPRREQEALINAHADEFDMTRDEITAALQAVRQDGLSVAWGEVTPGVVGVAAPILAADRAPIAALCLTSDAETMTDTRLATIRAAIRKHAAAIGAALRAQSAPHSRTG